MNLKSQPQLVYVEINFSNSLFSRQSSAELQRIISVLEETPSSDLVVLTPRANLSDYHLSWLEEIKEASRQDLLELCQQNWEFVRNIRFYSDRLIFLSKTRCIGSINILAAVCSLRILTKPGLQYGCDEFERGFFLPTMYRKRRRGGGAPLFELVETRRDFAGSKTMHGQWVLWEGSEFQDEKIWRAMFEQRKISNSVDAWATPTDQHTQEKSDTDETAAVLVDQFMSQDYQDFLINCICHSLPATAKEASAPSTVYMNVTTDHLPFRFVARSMLAGSFVIFKASHHDDLLRYMNLASYQFTQSYHQELAESLWFHRIASVVTDHLNPKQLLVSLTNEGHFKLSFNHSEFAFYYLGSTKQGVLVLEDYLGHIQSDHLLPIIKDFLNLNCLCLTNPIVETKDLQAVPFAKVMRFFMLVEMQRLRKQEGITFHEIMEAFERNNEHKKTVRMAWTRMIQQLDKEFMQSAFLKRCADYLELDLPNLVSIKDLIDPRSSSFSAVQKKQEWTPTFVVRHLQTWARTIVSQFNQEGSLNLSSLVRGQFFYWSTGIFDPATALWQPGLNSLEGPSLFHGRKYWPFLPRLGAKEFASSGIFHHNS